MASASARHILVSDRAKCEELKQQISDGASFADVARDHSTCPSGAKVATSAHSSPGKMVKEFDAVVFSDEVGIVHGPVQTQFGFHLLEITERTD